MALKDRVKARVSRALLVQLTNQQDPSRTVIDDAVLDAAVADTEAEFLVEAGLAYDDTDALHVAVAVQGVIYRLQTYAMTTGRVMDEARQRWERGLIRIAQTRGGERRLLPSSSSPLSPSTQASGSRPDFDRERWSGYTLESPSLSDADPDEGVRGV